jgi:hypothetical protein
VRRPRFSGALFFNHSLGIDSENMPDEFRCIMAAARNSIGMRIPQDA